MLVRHGQTDGSDRYYGRTDNDLNAAGREQAEGLRRRLASEKINAVYTSTLKRAIATAEAIATGRGLEITCCSELDEVDFGKLEGMTYEEICRQYPTVAASWTDWSAQLEFPGGESASLFGQRVVRFLERLKSHNDDETILVVGHGGPLRLLLCRLLGLGIKHCNQFTFGLASISVVNRYSQGAILSQLSDVCHLGKGKPQRG
ncbi:MAG: histidine phosphatase family protein [Dehalococcoidales bacterium]